jgi:type I restriction enzyme, S subunit
MNAVSPVETLFTDHLDLWTTALKRKSTAGRGSSSKVELYGIKKLRELILELAVRGLLVPQDPNDEPASELLKKIAAEKARLVKEGKIKLGKPLPPAGHDETVFSLPSGWAWCRLDNLSLHSEAGWSPKCEEIPRTGSDWGVLKVSAVTWGVFNPAENKVLPATLDAVPEYEVKPGDFLVSRANTSDLVARSVVVQNDAPAKLMLSDKIIRFKFSQEVCAPYLSLFNNSSGARRYYLQVAGGTSSSMKNVSRLQIQSLVVALPPPAEQHRIVAKVDELMALCDQLAQETEASLSAHQTLVETLLSALTSAADHAQFASAWRRIAGHFDMLFTTEESIAQLKQTILQLAVMGKLVPQDPNDEPASELLKKIAAEKAKLVKEGKIKKDKPLPLVTEVESVYELPAGWEWARLGDVTSGMDSGWSPACLEHMSTSDDVWGVLKTTAVQVMQYWEHENKELPSKLNPRPEAEAKVGDILFTRAGPKNRVGISCFVDQTRPRLMISDKIIRFHPIEIGVYGRFLALSLNSGGTAEYLEKAKSGMAASQVNISQEKLRCAPVPLLPLAEQHRIVAKVDELMALCDQLKSRLSDAQATQLHLADALVERAIG